MLYKKNFVCTPSILNYTEYLLDSTATNLSGGDAYIISKPEFSPNVPHLDHQLHYFISTKNSQAFAG